MATTAHSVWLVSANMFRVPLLRAPLFPIFYPQAEQASIFLSKFFGLDHPLYHSYHLHQQEDCTLLLLVAHQTKQPTTTLRTGCLSFSFAPTNCFWPKVLRLYPPLKQEDISTWWSLWHTDLPFPHHRAHSYLRLFAAKGVNQIANWPPSSLKSQNRSYLLT